MVKSRGKSFTCSMQKTTHQAWPTFGDFLGFELSIASQEKLQVGLLPKASFIGHLSLEVREQGYLRAKLSALKLDKQITQSKWGKASKVGKIVRSSLSHPTPPSLLHLNCGNCTRLQSPVALLNQEHPFECSEAVTEMQTALYSQVQDNPLGDNYCAVHPTDPSFPFAGSTSQTPFRQPPHRFSSGTPWRLASTCCPHPVQVYLPQPLHVTFRHMALNATGRKLKRALSVSVCAPKVTAAETG